MTDPDPNTLSRANLLRYRLGRPLIVNSWIRCAYWNAHEGGEGDSGHLKGTEIDFRCETSSERYQILQGIFQGQAPLFPRVGIAKMFIHVGLSPLLPQRVVWLYPAADAR